jgi:uncharacterized protein (DUF3820 family)
VKIDFGKWRGCEVSKLDDSYLAWLARTNADLPADLLAAILHELHARHTRLLESYRLGRCVTPLPEDLEQHL